MLRSSTCSTLAKALSSPGNPQKAFSALSLISAHHQTKPISAFEKSSSDFVALSDMLVMTIIIPYIQKGDSSVLSLLAKTYQQGKG